MTEGPAPSGADQRLQARGSRRSPFGGFDLAARRDMLFPSILALISTVGAAVGVLNVESHEALTDHDRDLLELFASQLATVLRNARLAGELRDRAEHDPLTHLLNRGALIDALGRLLAGAREVCSVLLIDLDSFKEINDRHGHLARDAVLQHIAALLRMSCREDDLCSRIGGDEFVIVLPRGG